MTAVPADSGKDKAGGATPDRFLVEWEGVDDVAYYVLESQDNRYDVDWVSDPSQTRYWPWDPHERSYDRSDRRGESPGVYYLFRVCAQNIGGRTCSPAASTLGSVVIGGKADSTMRPPGGAAGGFGRPEGVKPATRVDAGPSGAPGPICDSARAATERGSSAASGLVNQCEALLNATMMSPASAETNALAARGESIAQETAWFTELRALQPEGPVLRGFDIAMAAAQGQRQHSRGGANGIG